MNSQLLTLVLGASLNVHRASHIAVLKMRDMAIPVVAIGRLKGYIGDIKILTGRPKLTELHTASVYLNAKNQKPFYEYILDLKPKRIIFNPGAENAELESLAHHKGIVTERACTLVLLATDTYNMNTGLK